MYPETEKCVKRKRPGSATYAAPRAPLTKRRAPSKVPCVYRFGAGAATITLYAEYARKNPMKPEGLNRVESETLCKFA